MRAAPAKRRQKPFCSLMYTQSPGTCSVGVAQTAPKSFWIYRPQKRKKIESGVLEVAGNLLVSPQISSHNTVLPAIPRLVPVESSEPAITLLGVGGIKPRFTARSFFIFCYCSACRRFSLNWGITLRGLNSQAQGSSYWGAEAPSIIRVQSLVERGRGRRDRLA